MNVIDLMVLFAFASAGLRGYQIGFIRQLGSTAGFIIGLLAGVTLGRWIAQLASSSGSKTLVELIVIFVVAFGLMVVGEWLSAKLKTKLAAKTAVNRVDNAGGTIMSFATLVVGLWFATALVALLPANGLQPTIRQSFTFGVLDRNLPPASQLLTSLNTFIDPNDSPLVFSSSEPSPDANFELLSTEWYKGTIDRVEPSVVRIQGLGCGGIVNGSGFVIAKNRVATNAHVVAGVKNPKVHDAAGTHDATIVLFNPTMDVAVLEVEGLSGTPLPLMAEPALAAGDRAIVIGYPGGGRETSQVVGIVEQIDALGRDIYSKEKSVRNVYSMQANLQKGNSGGPVLNVKGEVVGIVFGTSTTYNNIGYALSLSQVMPELAYALTASQPQHTGGCSNI